MIKKIFWLFMSFFVVILDQITKYWVTKNFLFAKPYYLLPFLNVDLSYNTGAAFSFLGKYSGWQTYFFVLLTILIVIVLVGWIVSKSPKSILQYCALSLILGGALGNLYDRLIHGFVIDFISFHVKDWYFAIFNVADMAITIGVMLLILNWIVLKR